MTVGEVARTLAGREEKALVGFLTAGYPDVETFVALARAAAESCDVLEIGIPFSDPIADGPLIQRSSLRALQNGITLGRCFDLAARLADEIDTPLVFMSYYNPILRMGEARFADRAVSCGVSGVIIPDVSFEESGPIRTVLASGGVTFIDLVAPTSGDDRIARIAREAEGFLYLVSVTGVTGARSPEEEELARFVDRVREHSRTPLYVGFGISDADRARSVVRSADGVIIGSALVGRVESAGTSDEAVAAVAAFLGDVKSAIGGAPRGDTKS